MRATRARCGVILLLAVSSLTGCAHTKSLGQSFVALGALVLGLSTLDAAGVLGSDCAQQYPPNGGDPVYSCSGDGVVPHSVDIVGLALGAGLIGAGVALWTTDSQPPPVQTQLFPSPQPHAETALGPRLTAPTQ
jgi:hypothetical protein